jgi:CHASE3 domain sensor protein
MSLESLYREKMYVLGPLELCPGQFAVGERSYIAIKGKMPYYNEMRQKFYLDGNKEVGDAIGELETRALTAEESLDRMTSTNKSSLTKLKAATEEIAALKKNLEAMKKDHEDIKKKLEKEVRITRKMMEDKQWTLK